MPGYIKLYWNIEWLWVILFCEEFDSSTAAVCLNNQGTDSKWETLLMIFCCGYKAQQMQLPEGKWQVLMDGNSSFLWQLHIGVRAAVPRRPKPPSFWVNYPKEPLNDHFAAQLSLRNSKFKIVVSPAAEI